MLKVRGITYLLYGEILLLLLSIAAIAKGGGRVVRVDVASPFVY